MKKMLLTTLMLFSFAAAARANSEDCYNNPSENTEENFATCMAEAVVGDPLASSFVGIFYLNGTGVTKDLKEAMKWVEEAAYAGIWSSQYSLGGMYFSGTGVEQDYTEAVRWYRAAAERGMDRAQSNLASMYDEGQGVAQNYTEAVKWFEKAAEQGSANDQYNLGVMYFKGKVRGVEQDRVLGHMWFNIAGANGVESAAKYRDQLAEKMTAAQVQEAQSLVKDWMAQHP